MRTLFPYISPNAGARSRTRLLGGFTVVELLVVVAVLAVLAALLLPAVSRSKIVAQKASCGHNFKELQLAWLLYTVDFHDALPANKWNQVSWEDGCPSGHQTTADAWVLGDTTVDTTSWNVQNGCLFPYTRQGSFYRCPMDRSTVDGQPKIPRQRSYSMSYYMNGSEMKPERKSQLAEIKSTSSSFVFIEEHQDSINDGVFFVHVIGDEGEQAEVQNDREYGGAHWMDYPSDRHEQGCNLSFADGHVEHWKWRWPKQIDPNSSYPVNRADFEDMRRLQACIPAR